MKLILITSIKEDQKTVAQLVEQSGIDVFSTSEIIGFKEHDKANLLDNWFSSGTEHFDSILLFSFTTAEKADKALDLIKHHNASNKTGFPIRGFILPVEKAGY